MFGVLITAYHVKGLVAGCLFGPAGLGGKILRPCFRFDGFRGPSILPMVSESCWLIFSFLRIANPSRWQKWNHGRNGIKIYPAGSAGCYFSVSVCSPAFQISIGAVIGKELRKTKNVLIRHISLGRSTQSSLKPDHQELSKVQKYQKSS